MTKKFWLHIQHNYPKALEACTTFFKSQYQDSWRQEIRSSKQLLTFFKQQGIRVELLWKWGSTGEKSYGYRIKSNYYQVHLHYLYSKQEITYINAFSWSFKILEFQIKRKEIRTPPVIFSKKKNRRN